MNPATALTVRLAAVLGLATGVALAVLLVAGWQVAPGDGLARTSLTLVANDTGALAMGHAGAFLRDADVSRRPAHGRLEPANQTGRPLWVRLRVLPSSPDLGRGLVVTAVADGVPVYHGRLDGLGVWTTQRFRIRPGARARLDLTVAAAPGARREIQGRVEQLDVEFGVRAAAR